MKTCAQACIYIHTCSTKKNDAEDQEHVSRGGGGSAATHPLLSGENWGHGAAFGSRSILRGYVWKEGCLVKLSTGRGNT